MDILLTDEERFALDKYEDPRKEAGSEAVEPLIGGGNA